MFQTEKLKWNRLGNFSFAIEFLAGKTIVNSKIYDA